MSKSFKYKSEIQQIQKMGICCPTEELSVPNNLKAFRFVFDDPNHIKNHKPPGVLNPQRILSTNDKKKCSLYGLSCFKVQESARLFFNNFIKHSPKFYLLVGDTLSTGILDEDDGMITSEDKDTHFDLFEFETCNLSDKFSPIEKLI